MKICALIAEYNPFHLGHLKHIEYIKSVLHAEKVVVIMSGNFTQRGEIAVMNKFTRAKHAVLAGADAVIELPTVFATANAETFATGAINILNSLGCIDCICFGVESGEKQEYHDLASKLVDESKEFKRALKAQLEQGVSLAKAKFLAVKETYGDFFNENLINSPNNILGLEYVKAILKFNSKIDFFPMLREGDHNDQTLKKGVTSATSIRQVIKTEKLKKLKACMPSYVFNDLKQYPFSFDKLCMASLITTPAEELAKIADCSEGLENRIKALSKDNRNIEDLIEKVTTKRYPATRIRRILTNNLLGIKEDLVKDCLFASLYAKVLAVDSAKKEIISELNLNSAIPLLTRKSDGLNLKKAAINCFNKDVLANDLYNLITDEKTNEHYMLTV